MEVNLKECPKCGKRSSGYECPECGSSLNNAKTIQSHVEYESNKPTSNCPYCGKPNSPNAKWCAYCKEYLDKRSSSSTSGHSMQYYSATAESNVGIYIISFIVPLVGFIIGGIRLGKNEDGGMGCIVSGIASVVIGSLIMLTMK